MRSIRLTLAWALNRVGYWIAFRLPSACSKIDAFNRWVSARGDRMCEIEHTLGVYWFTQRGVDDRGWGHMYEES